MALLKVSDKQWNITSEGGTFAINSDDSNTAQMLIDFQNDPAKLAYFESLIIQHGAPYAYYAYNGLQIPISIIEAE
jgi:hypothetical protein